MYTDVKSCIFEMHGNKVDNEVRYLKQLLAQDHPDMEVRRRDKKTSLLDLLHMMKEGSSDGSTTHSDESRGVDDDDLDDVPLENTSRSSGKKSTNDVQVLLG